MILKYLLFSLFLLLSVAVLSFLFTWVVLKCSHHFEFYDRNEERKVHSGKIPRLGGVAIMSSLALGIFTGEFLVVRVMFSTPHNLRTIFLWSLALFGIFILGLLDDLKGLNAYQKFPVQFLLATFLYFVGFRIENLSLPWGGSIHLGFWDFPLVLLWIVGVMNAINIIDGLDGLAAGISLVASLSMFVVFFVHGKYPYAAVMAGMSGALLGFLPFNIHPAKIFMGDSGSLSLGFILGTLAMKTSEKANLTISLSMALIMLFIPLMDTGLAILRRWRNRKPLFSADKDHIHHRLLKKTGSHGKAVLILVLLSALFSLNGVLMALVEGYPRMLSIIITLVAGFFVVWRLEYFSIKGNVKAGMVKLPFPRRRTL